MTASNTSKANTKVDAQNQSSFVNQAYNSASIGELQRMKAEQDARNAAQKKNGHKPKSHGFFGKLADSVLEGFGNAGSGSAKY